MPNRITNRHVFRWLPHGGGFSHFNRSFPSYFRLVERCSALTATGCTVRLRKHHNPLYSFWRNRPASPECSVNDPRYAAGQPSEVLLRETMEQNEGAMEGLLQK